MERNILQKIRSGDVGNDTGSPTPDPISFGQDGSYEGRPRRSSIGGGIRLVRTISTIDGECCEAETKENDHLIYVSVVYCFLVGTDELLEMMKHSTSHEEGGSILMQAKSIDDESAYLSRYTPQLSSESKEAKGEPKARSIKSPVEEPVKKPTLRRRNSTGTLYVDSTMSKQDNLHTMDCISVVIRSHMLDAAKENVEPRKEYDVFKDVEESGSEAKEAKSSSGGSSKVC